MSNVVMLKRAFNQAVATGAVRFTDPETDFLVIRRYMIDYAAKYNVDIAVSEIESFIRKQQGNLIDISTKITGEGRDIKIENVAVTNAPPKLTKEEMLKEAFDDAAANAAVRFTDKVADFLVIRNAMEQYANIHGHAFTKDEIEEYIRTQEKMWDDSITDVMVDSAGKVQKIHASDMYKPEPMTKEKVLLDGFAEGIANPAVRFADMHVDFLVIKKIMQEYAVRWNVEVTEDEIVACIKEQFKKMNDAARDWTYGLTK